MHLEKCTSQPGLHPCAAVDECELERVLAGLDALEDRERAPAVPVAAVVPVIVYDISMGLDKLDELLAGLDAIVDPLHAVEPSVCNKANQPVADEPAVALVRKKANPKSAKSAFRDACFRVFPQGFSVSLAEPEDEGTSVSIAAYPPSSCSPTPAPLATSVPTSLPTSPAPTPAAYQPEELSRKDARRHARFWSSYTTQPLTGLRQHVTAAAWRDLSDVYRLEWFHHSMRAQGFPVWALTVNFDEDVEAQVRREPKAAKWIADRMNLRLEKALGRKVSFWFAFDITTEGQPRRVHMHGEIALTPDELDVARAALRKAAGEWGHSRQFQVETKPVSLSWVGYVAKNAFLLRRHTGRLAKMIVRPISGEWFHASNIVRSSAAELYGQSVR